MKIIGGLIGKSVWACIVMSLAMLLTYSASQNVYGQVIGHKIMEGRHSVDFGAPSLHLLFHSLTIGAMFDPARTNMMSVNLPISVPLLDFSKVDLSIPPVRVRNKKVVHFRTQQLVGGVRVALSGRSRAGSYFYVHVSTSQFILSLSGDWQDGYVDVRLEVPRKNIDQGGIDLGDHQVDIPHGSDNSLEQQAFNGQPMNEPKIIDILFVLDSGTFSSQNEPFHSSQLEKIVDDIDEAIELGNAAYANSQVPVLLHRVAVSEIDFAPATEDSVANWQALVGSSAVEAERQLVNADVVVGIVNDLYDCGIAQVAANYSTAKTVIKRNKLGGSNCLISGPALVHEIGHLLGSRHDAKQQGYLDPNQTPNEGFGFDYCRDQDEQGQCESELGTIMSYTVPKPFEPWYVSSAYHKFRPFPVGIEGHANNHRVFTNNAPAISAFRQGVYPPHIKTVQRVSVTTNLANVIDLGFTSELTADQYWIYAKSHQPPSCLPEEFRGLSSRSEFRDRYAIEDHYTYYAVRVVSDGFAGPCTVFQQPGVRRAAGYPLLINEITQTHSFGEEYLRVSTTVDPWDFDITHLRLFIGSTPSVTCSGPDQGFKKLSTWSSVPSIKSSDALAPGTYYIRIRGENPSTGFITQCSPAEMFEVKSETTTIKEVSQGTDASQILIHFKYFANEQIDYFIVYSSYLGGGYGCELDEPFTPVQTIGYNNPSGSMFGDGTLVWFTNSFLTHHFSIQAYRVDQGENVKVGGCSNIESGYIAQTDGGAPVNLVATQGDGGYYPDRIALSWAPTGGDGYRIYRSENPNETAACSGPPLYEVVGSHKTFIYDFISDEEKNVSLENGAKIGRYYYWVSTLNVNYITDCSVNNHGSDEQQWDPNSDDADHSSSQIGQRIDLSNFTPGDTVPEDDSGCPVVDVIKTSQGCSGPAMGKTAPTEQSMWTGPKSSSDEIGAPSIHP